MSLLSYNLVKSLVLSLETWLKGQLGQSTMKLHMLAKFPNAEQHGKHRHGYSVDFTDIVYLLYTQSTKLCSYAPFSGSFVTAVQFRKA